MRPLAILGPTASGKSAVALALVESISTVAPAEIVSIDAMQVYRRMDVGTAKPSADEQERVRHHLIDLVDPSEDFTVARFQTAYRDVRTDLMGRGVTPLLVGGTGLYLRAVIDDLDIPGQWPEIRARLEAEVENLGVESLYSRLADSDPRAASKIDPHNARRVVRALEVLEGSGRAFSSYGPGVDTYPPTDVIQVALRWSRDALARRIEDRVQVMLESGWLDEARRLTDGPLSRTASRALGYHELFEHLAGRLSLSEAVETIVLRTRQFAVRQERWFRRDPRIVWFDLDRDDGEMSDVIARIRGLWVGVD
ncbi:MAG: tRNA (adenosine(37)-N6)-dimethylallyltransferase MiaA [Actinomycetota bacterium]|nr:tRNA (adenosine(37)-N6)-dimethylallyltransferase MiaA [Actinomycetota bacterium]MDA2971148.1 tRNA (adenosine(37)-N6)-dimethylallyltransferase MiaA [Actinomycetota bacterium]MDA3000899.1 tRNA (adenosine(37)-N6)-dimethylallyltransferase MiaA [Actinomycetota bacterium]